MIENRYAPQVASKMTNLEDDFDSKNKEEAKALRAELSIVKSAMDDSIKGKFSKKITDSFDTIDKKIEKLGT